jgi:hypothetical protein
MQRTRVLGIPNSGEVEDCLEKFQSSLDVLAMDWY